MLVGVALVAGLVSGQFSVSADGGGFDTASEAAREARRRIAIIEAPRTLDGQLRVTDSFQTRSELKLGLLGATAQAGTVSGSSVTYGSAMTLVQENEQTLVLRISGRFEFALSTQLQFERVDARTVEFGRRWRVSTPQNLDASAVGLSGGATGATTELRVQLMTVSLADMAATNSNTAEALWGAAMAWDPLRHRLMRFGGATNFSGRQCGTCEDGTTWVLADGDDAWVALNTPAPPLRLRSTLTWDPVRQVMVLFGGATDGVRLNDTWEFTENGWVERTPAHRPPVRWGHATTWSPVRGRMVLFGGFNSPSASGTEYGDVWEWDGTDWIEVPTTMGPSRRDSHALVFDENLGEVLLIGGWDGSVSLNDVWSWNGTRWQLLQFAAPFSPRCSLNVAWDPVRRRVVIAGGWAPEVSYSQMFEDTLAFDGTRWVSAGLLPVSSHRVALASHPVLGIVGFGGKSDSATFGWTLTPGFPRWSSLPAMLPTGPVSNRTPVHTVLRGTTLRELNSNWWTVGPVPFTSALELVDTSLGGVVLAPDDAGVAVWEQRQTWSLVEAAPALSLAFDDQRDEVWVAHEDGALSVRRAGVWEDGGVLPADAGALSAASNGRLYLRGDEVLRFEPQTGMLTRIAPAAFIEAHVLRYDARREVLLASRPGDSSVLEWHRDAWVQVSTTPTQNAWSGPPWKTIGEDKRLATYEPLRTLGAACRDGQQCASTFCADGVCCESACANSECVMCSVAAGGEEDGRCTTVRAWGQTRCGSDDPCFVRTCEPGVEACPSPVNVCFPDAGEPMQPVVPPVDAGVRPIRRPALDSTLSPALCRCSSAEGVFTLVVLVGLLRRRRV